MEFWLDLLNQLKSIGWLAPICLACLESFLPALPLLAIISFNLAVYGVWQGAIASWIGTTCGSLIVFLIFRKGIKPLFSAVKQPDFLRRIKGSLLNIPCVFILYCLPFAPGNFLNAACGLSDLKVRTFFRLIPLAKAIFVMITVLFTVTGYHVKDSWQGIFLMLLLTVGFLLLTRRLQSRLDIKK